MSAKIKAAVSGAAIAAVAIAAALPANAASAQPRATLGAAPQWTASAHAAAAASSSTQLRMSLTLTLRKPASAESLARAVSTPGSKSYRHFISAAKWRQLFAPTDASVKTVRSWLTSNGFSVGSIPANHRAIAFTGTVAQAQKAFGTSLKSFDKGGLRVVAPTTATSVPASLAGLVTSVSGLDTSARKVPNRVGGAETKTTGSSASLKASAKVTPSDVLPPPDDGFKNGRPCSSFYGQKHASTLPAIAGLHPLTYAPCGYLPSQLRGAYGFDASQSQGFDGRGVRVAIVDAYASPYIFQDAKKYAERNDPSHPFRAAQFRQNLPATFTDTEDCDAGGWYGEETLDVEAVHAMAPAANILYVGTQSCNDPDFDSAVNTIVDNHLADIVSNSYGETDDIAAGDAANVHQTLLQAAAEGISFVYSSGDDGDEIVASGIRQTDSSASDPLATAVGGTSLAVTKHKGYGFEQGWGTGKSTLTDGAWTPLPSAYLYGGGGGESDLWAEPWYQRGVVPGAISHQTSTGKAGRTVPDVALVGDPTTGFLEGQTQSFPDGIKYGEYRIGGTSLSAPLFAGITAVANQVAGGSLGFLNPVLYGNVYGTNAVRDVNHGRRVTDGLVRVDFDNGVDAADGTTLTVRTLNQTGTIYTRKGYDDVTGIGSPNGVRYLNKVTAPARHSGR
jgi:subtilase family serine protease